MRKEVRAESEGGGVRGRERKGRMEEGEGAGEGSVRERGHTSSEKPPFLSE